MANENEILTIAGERVEVRYESDYYEACEKCCFRNIVVGCNVQTLCHGRPCEKYRDHENRRFAYFVRTEFDKMCPSQPIQGSIAPEVDLEKEIKRFLSNATKMNKGEWRGKYPISDIGFRAVARHFAEWGAEHLKK